MATTTECELNRWTWQDTSFPFPFPQTFDAAYFRRFGSDRGIRAELVEMLDWLQIRTLDCIAYAETQRWPDQPYPKLSLHVFPPAAEGGAMFGGFAFVWERRKIHAMAIWHRNDPMDAEKFVGRALPESTAMAR